MKTIVVNKQEKSRVPFLRGILIRTLLEANMSFEKAYELAALVREQLTGTEEITTEDLRRKVSGLLSEAGEPGILEQYRMPMVSPSRILVLSGGGSQTLFSRGKLQRNLLSGGVRQGDAERITTLIFDQLLATGATHIEAEKLGYLIYVCLLQELGDTVAKQYLVWQEFQQSGRPMILLISGAVGSGKSSIATELAHQLNIDRTQSTDMLREVMRTIIPSKLLPILHRSSFDAWKTLPGKDIKPRDKDRLIAEGFRSQANLLAVPCEAVMRRAVKESVSLILEGVHSHPDLLHTISPDSDAILVHVTLAVLNSQELKSRLRGRGEDVPLRRSRRYLNKFDSIWRLQSFLLGEADLHDTPIIPNEDMEVAIFQIIGTVNSELALHFSGNPRNSFARQMRSAKTRVSGNTWQQMVPHLLGTKNN